MTTAEDGIAEQLHKTLLFAPPELWLLHIRRALEEAGDRVRERCAKVADDFSFGYEAVRASEGQSWCPSCKEYTRDVADEIARAIRKGE